MDFKPLILLLCALVARGVPLDKSSSTQNSTININGNDLKQNESNATDSEEADGISVKISALNGTDVNVTVSENETNGTDVSLSLHENNGTDVSVRIAGFDSNITHVNNETDISVKISGDDNKETNGTGVSIRILGIDHILAQNETNGTSSNSIDVQIAGNASNTTNVNDVSARILIDGLNVMESNDTGIEVNGIPGVETNSSNSEGNLTLSNATSTEANAETNATKPSIGMRMLDFGGLLGVAIGGTSENPTTPMVKNATSTVENVTIAENSTEVTTQIDQNNSTEVPAENTTNSTDFEDRMMENGNSSSVNNSTELRVIDVPNFENVSSILSDVGLKLENSEQKKNATSVPEANNTKIEDDDDEDALKVIPLLAI